MDCVNSRLFARRDRITKVRLQLFQQILLVLIVDECEAVTAFLGAVFVEPSIHALVIASNPKVVGNPNCVLHESVLASLFGDRGSILRATRSEDELAG